MPSRVSGLLVEPETNYGYSDIEMNRVVNSFSKYLLRSVVRGWTMTPIKRDKPLPGGAHALAGDTRSKNQTTYPGEDNGYNKQGSWGGGERLFQRRAL